MNHRRQLAAALACATALGLCAGHTLANEAPAPTNTEEPPLILAPAAPADDDPAPVTEEADPIFSPVIIENEDQGPISPDIRPSERKDEAGTVSFANLRSRMLEHNLNIRSLDASIDSASVVDYEELEYSLKSQKQMLRNQQTQMQQAIAGTNSAIDALQASLTAMETGIDITAFKDILNLYPQSAILSLGTQINSLDNTIDGIDAMSEQSNNAVRQLQNAKDQILMGGETLYISLLGLEQTQQGLQRQLKALDRTIAELEVRYEMGQISALTLTEAKAGRTSLVSGMQTLKMNINNMTRQLESMLGLEPTGKLQLQPLTAITDKQLAKMDYDADLQTVKKNSYEISSAKYSLSTANDKLDNLVYPTNGGYEFDSAEFGVKSAKLNLEATQQSVELKFAALYDLVHDQKQVLDAARTALAIKQDNYAVAQLKYSQGVISKNAMLDAADAVSEAQATVDTAAIDLFTSYNNYRWAVENGILN